jgi:hypothetical protein
MKNWLQLALHGAVCRRAFKVALLVGCILAVINHGDALLSGTATTSTWLKIGLTFLVPYCVSTFATVQTMRQHAADAARS